MKGANLTFLEIFTVFKMEAIFKMAAKIKLSCKCLKFLLLFLMLL